MNTIFVPMDNSDTVSRFTHQEMYDKFTETELKRIFSAAKTVVDVEIWVARFNSAPYIDIADPRTIKGINDLEAASMLDGPGRASEILSY